MSVYGNVYGSAAGPTADEVAVAVAAKVLVRPEVPIDNKPDGSVVASNAGGGAGVSDEDKAEIADGVAMRLAGQSLTYVGPINPESGEVLIYAGDAYEGDRALRWVRANYTGGVQDGDTVDLRFLSTGRYRSERETNIADAEFVGAATLADGTLTITVPLTSGKTANIATVSPVDEAPTHRAMVIKGDETLVDVPATVMRRIRPKP